MVLRLPPEDPVVVDTHIELCAHCTYLDRRIDPSVSKRLGPDEPEHSSASTTLALQDTFVNDGSVRLSDRPSVHLSVRPSVLLSVCLPVCQHEAVGVCLSAGGGAAGAGR